MGSAETKPETPQDPEMPSSMTGIDIIEAKFQALGIDMLQPIKGKCLHCRQHVFAVCNICCHLPDGTDSMHACTKCENFGLTKEQLYEARNLFRDLAANVSLISEKLAQIYLVFMKLCALRHHTFDSYDDINQMYVYFCGKTCSELNVLFSGSPTCNNSALVQLLKSVVIKSTKQRAMSSTKAQVAAAIANLTTEDEKTAAIHMVLANRQTRLMQRAQKLIQKARASAQAQSRIFNEDVGRQILERCDMVGPAMFLEYMSVSQ